MSTWNGGAGNWSDCPPTGTALWDTCPKPGFPNGNFDAVINGGPVNATSASIVNLTINSGGSLVFPPSVPSILDITGTSMVNNGSISLAGTDGLQLEGNTTVTLSGSGSVTMAGNNFTGGNGQPTLILQQPVQGQGSFSLGMILNNQSTINATGGTLSMQPISATNTGTMEASSTGTLAFTNGVETAYNNTGGTIQALSGGIVQLENGIYTGGTLTTTGTGVIQLSGDAILNNLTNTGTVQVSNNTALLQGTVTNTGTINLQTNATLFMSGNVTLVGSGSVNLSGSSNLDANFTSVGLSGGQLTSQQLIHGSGTFDKLPVTNQATIAADSSGNTLFLTGSTVTNTSTMEASGGGILQIDGDETILNTGGIIEALTGSTVNIVGTIKGGTLTTTGTGVIQSQNATLDGTVNIPTNAGKLNVKTFDLFLQGTINNTGTITLSGTSCVILNQPSTLTGSGKLIMASTTCIFGSGNAFTNQSTIEGSGSIGDSNPMPITNNGTILANQKSPLLIVPDATGFTNNGKLMVNPGSTLDLKGLFNNLSTTGTLTGGTYAVSGLLSFPNAVVTNGANITLTGASAEIFNNNNSNNALLTLAANTTKGVLSVQKGQLLTTGTGFSNAGKMTVAAGGALTIGGAYTQTAGTTTVDGTLTASGGLTLQKGSLVGKGTVAAAVTSDATVTVGDATTKAGQLSVTAYTQNSTGVLDIAIGGKTVGTQYSQLAVSNGASLNGTLTIKLINGFTPAINDVYTILTGSAVSGQFSKVNGLSINSGEHFEISYSGTAVTLTVAAGA